VLQLQVAGAQGNGFGDAFGDESSPDSGEAGERDRRAVVSMKAFGFNQTLADESKAALACMFGGSLLLFLVEDSGSCSGRGGKDEELSIGEDAVHVEE